jgi:ubiquinone/menaquinone biosynthesis C-methylase UbiE
VSRISDRQAGVAAYYDKAAGIVPEFTVLNYGFSSDSTPSNVADDEPERYCLRLYEHALRHTRLEGADVLEVSCGRGGGAAYLDRTHGPARYIGVDLSPENLKIARSRFTRPQFLLGNAEALAFVDASFDVVINIEASHLYDDRKAFFAEVFRVLRPGGQFCYADGCWASDDCSQDLSRAGFELNERMEITPNVVRALELDSARREALFDAMTADDELRVEYKDWGGVVGFRAHRRFINGETCYFSHLLTKP